MTRPILYPGTSAKGKCLVRALFFLCLGSVSVGSTIGGDHVRFQKISLEQGLSQNVVLSILQDSQGFLWFGTFDGLNKYDGYDFTVYKRNRGNPSSISDNNVFAMLEGPEGEIWIGTSQGLNRFDRIRQTFTHYLHDPERADSLSDNRVRALYRDRLGYLWVGTTGGLNRLNPENEGFDRFLHDPDDSSSLSDDRVRVLFGDREGRLWVGTAAGLNRYDPVNDGFIRYRHRPGDLAGLRHGEIRSMLQDSRGRLWIGTYDGLNLFVEETQDFRFMPLAEKSDSEELVTVLALLEDGNRNLWVGTSHGLFNLDPDSGEFAHYTSNLMDPDSLSHDVVRALYEDRTGIVWIGTRGGGVNKFDPKTLAFHHLKHQPGNPDSLHHNLVRAIFEDAGGDLWIGTSGGGLDRFDRQDGHVRHYQRDPHRPESLSNNQVWSLERGANGDLWVGTERGLNRLDPISGTAAVFTNDPSSPASISNDRIWALLMDRDQVLWVGTDNGLNSLKAERDGFHRYYEENPEMPGLTDNRIWSLFEDEARNLWVGTNRGLTRLDPARQNFTHFKHNPDSEYGLSDDRIWCIHEDDSGVVWIGTDGGLNRFVPGENRFRAFYEEDGLPNEVIYGILGDGRGMLWLSTGKGLSRFDPDTLAFRNYDVSDGLQGKEFSQGAYFKGADGRLYFGGVNGINAFFPEEIRDDPHPPPVAITDFLTFNESVPLRKDREDSPLSAHISHTEAMVLTHRDYVFSFEFAALHFADPRRNRYAYKLEGFDNHWNYTGADKRFATYTRLGSGSYVLRVKAANKDGHWNETGTSVKLRILPPPWQTWWAYGLYVMAFLTLVSGFVWSQRRKLARERALNERLIHVDRLKDEFLANTSHELRTPLHGIIGLADSLIEGAAGALPKKAVSDLAMIGSSGRRLSNLVNDILDFAKLKNKGIRLEPTPVDLHTLAGIVLTTFQPLVERRPLTLHNEIEPDFPLAWADENRVQQILYNLVGNAVKFTESGTVRISASEREDGLAVSVADTGIGIPKSQFEHIFKSFTQVDGRGTRVYSGTGLGLALTKKLVELHGGRIGVASTVARGSVFTFTLPPVSRKALAKRTPASPAEPLSLAVPETGPSATRASKLSGEREEPHAGFKVLVVDDESVNRQVVSNLLTFRNYRIVQAASGTQALELLEGDHGIRLVLLDIMMPRMSGYEVCRLIREKYSIHELPVIFMTAKNQEEDIVAGFAAGANDYITKPIGKEELTARVETQLQLLDNNRRLESMVVERTRELGEKNQEVVRRQNQLITQEKLASLGSLTSGIAHEIKNPLNFVNNFAELSMELFQELRAAIEGIRESLPRPVAAEIETKLNDLGQNARVILKHGKRADEIMNSMMVLAKNRSGETEKTGINILVEDYTNLAFYGIQAKAHAAGVVIKKSFDHSVSNLKVVPQNLGLVIINLVNNALDAVLAKKALSGPDYEPTIRIGTKNLKHKLAIEVEDNGIGIPKEDHHRMFHPFFTTKTEGGPHIGLGLSISYDIVVREHHGDIHVDSREGGPTTFTILLPKP